MLLRVPYLGLPKELGAYSMLGFGDIILPGKCGYALSEVYPRG